MSEARTRRVLRFSVLAACASAAISACGQGQDTFASSHAPTGAETVFVAMGGYQSAGPTVTEPGHDDWTQLFYDQALSRRSTLYDLSSSAGPYVGDLLSGELTQALALHPNLVAIWIGMPDLLDGIAPATFERELEQVLTRLDAAHVRVLVANLLPIYRFPAYRTCATEALACGLGAQSLPAAAEMATGVTTYDQAISTAASSGRADVANLTGVFTSHLTSGHPDSAPIVDQSDLGLTTAGEKLVAGAFETAYSARRQGG
jgi:hypothetical protein